MILKCVICGNKFCAIRKSAKYCSKQCRRKADNNTERAKLARKEYYHKNKNKILKNSKEKRNNYTSDKKEEIKNRQHQYYLDNKEEILKKNNDWKKEKADCYKEYCKQYTKKYNCSEIGKFKNRMRAHKRRCILDNLEEIDYKALKDKFDSLDNKCVVCGSKENITIDHKIPVTKGGTNENTNLVLACVHCNCQKGNKTEEEYREWLNENKM